LGLSPQTLTCLHFFLLTCATVCFLALFGAKPCNYYFDAFHSFHNPYVLIQTRIEDYNRKKINFSFVGLLLQVILSDTSWFLRASAMLKHVIAMGLTSVCPSVRPSVRSSHAGTLSKRLNILSCFLHHTIAHSFYRVRQNKVAP